jgi:hypothetical protein
MQFLAEQSLQAVSSPSRTPEAKNQTTADPRRRWRKWAIGAVCIVAALLLFAIFHARTWTDARMAMQVESSGLPRAATAMKSASMPRMDAARVSQPDRAMAYDSIDAPAKRANPSLPAGPMIAHTVSLTIQVKDVPSSRSALDSMLARYHGYVSELNINTPENAARSFGASLRIPAQALAEALEDLRKLGRVQIESQSGEEVTQQHTDLVARLRNARETEQRLISILQQRTGKVSDVLAVEEQISNTRGEIERMEAELQSLEHRVDFASVQLQLTEDYKAQFNPPSATVGTRMHNAFVAGLGNAGDSILGILLFLEEYGPVLLVWFVVLGTPAWLVWRRYRRAESRATAS